MRCDAANPFNPTHRCALGLGHSSETAHTDGDAAWLDKPVSSDVEQNGDREDAITFRLRLARIEGFNEGRQWAIDFLRASLDYPGCAGIFADRMEAELRGDIEGVPDTRTNPGATDG